jgi:hypothetical protein
MLPSSSGLKRNQNEGINMQNLCSTFFLGFLLNPEEVTRFSETSPDFKRTTWRYIPENRTLHNHRYENFKSYIIYTYEQDRGFELCSKHGSLSTFLLVAVLMWLLVFLFTRTATECQIWDRRIDILQLRVDVAFGRPQRRVNWIQKTRTLRNKRENSTTYNRKYWTRARQHSANLRNNLRQ